MAVGEAEVEAGKWMERGGREKERGTEKEGGKERERVAGRHERRERRGEWIFQLMHRKAGVISLSH